LLFVFLLLIIGRYSHNQPPTKNYSDKNNIVVTSSLADNFISTSSDAEQIDSLSYSEPVSEKTATAETNSLETNAEPTATYYQVAKVVDGDTIDVDINGQIERIRLIGINTPEVVDPRRPVECFGKEASANAKKILSGQKVKIEADVSQDDRDKYGRLLRYAWRSDGLFYNLEAIKDGYAFEYTYHLPYKYQNEFKAAQKFAEENKIGLWADNACTDKTNATTSTTSKNCLIKGNISSNGEKIYHLPNCAYYQQTIIDESQGERWFCSEAEAQQAGWRKAKNCL
jgi:micrococcal nuclease